ncbi:HU family DNA-binding protein [Comamonas sp. PE63]|uniref:HU family DNA-binding protein n=1 Tax=Comamonas brasiliensis TaxID=1812482 RepID=UPI001B8D64EE
MNKSDLIGKIAEGTGLTKAEASRALDAALESIGHALKQGESVRLVGFGTFSVASRERRVGTDPRTGKKLVLKPMRIVKFRTGSILKKLVTMRSESMPLSGENGSSDDDLSSYF